eukprot:scaffold26190_cov119-Isochrysis_galbana.AAC.4
MSGGGRILDVDAVAETRPGHARHVCLYMQQLRRCVWGRLGGEVLFSRSLIPSHPPSHPSPAHPAQPPRHLSKPQTP